MAKSKIAKIKEEMFWQEFGPMCGNCKYLSSIMEKVLPYGIYAKEKNKRCTRENFATGKSNWCAEHEFK